MQSIELICEGNKPTATCTLWIQGMYVRWLKITHGTGRNQIDKLDTLCGSDAEALQLFAKRLSEFRAEGFRERSVPTPATPTVAASKPGKPAKKPRWLSKLPTDLLRQYKKLLAAGKRADLAHRFEEIEALIKVSVDLKLKKAKPADVRSVVSRIGGAPDLPEGFTWPAHRRIPLQFVAQVVLSEMKQHDLEGVLPTKGLLLFFAQLEIGEKAGDPAHASYGSVAHVEHVPALPKRGSERSPKCGPVAAETIGLLTPTARLSLPHCDDPEIIRLRLTDDERSRYHDELFLPALPRSPAHALLGYGTAGTAPSLAGNSFLAQFDSDSRIGFEEGDSQTLRFYLKAAGPAAQQFKSALSTLDDA